MCLRPVCNLETGLHFVRPVLRTNVRLNRVHSDILSKSIIFSHYFIHSKSLVRFAFRYESSKVGDFSSSFGRHPRDGVEWVTMAGDPSNQKIVYVKGPASLLQSFTFVLVAFL